ncbi:MAG: hypothetical protein NTY22_00385, partial [Proteobacteria bacterium]|nr:hypothetical protein [Pseudomonadota bacterium]
ALASASGMVDQKTTTADFNDTIGKLGVLLFGTKCFETGKVDDCCISQVLTVSDYVTTEFPKKFDKNIKDYDNTTNGFNKLGRAHKIYSELKELIEKPRLAKRGKDSLKKMTKEQKTDYDTIRSGKKTKTAAAATKTKPTTVAQQASTITSQMAGRTPVKR